MQRMSNISPAVALTGADLPAATTSTQGAAILATPSTDVTAGHIVQASDTRPRRLDYAAFAPGVPVALMKMLHLPMVRAWTLTIASCKADAGTAATASTVFTVRKLVSGSPTNLATVTFAIAGVSGTWADLSGGTLAVGDILEIIAPGTPDLTLADVGFNLFGALT